MEPQYNEYWTFINKIIQQNRKKGDGNLYYLHHIFPRSLYPLLKHKSWNWIYLTYKEHAYAHYLLAKLTIGKCKGKMQRVFNQYFNGEY